VSISTVPTLVELLVDPERVSDLPPAAAAQLLVRLTALQTALAVRALNSGADARQPAMGDRLLDVRAAATRLARSTDWLYRHANTLPFTVRDGRLLRFSERGIETYIRALAGRPGRAGRG
jgi:hypothetical protein